MNQLAYSYEDAGRGEEALNLREREMALERKVNGPKHPNTLRAMNNLSDSYCSLGRQKVTVALMEQACAAAPDDALEPFRLATFRAWFGQDTEYESIRCRLVQQAHGTDQANLADKAAKVYCLRPSTNAALLSEALNLARRAVERGQNEVWLPWYQLGLGLAEYRNGQYAAAERTLSIADQTGAGQQGIQGTARLFRAMSLFRQGRTEEARKLFRQAEAQMPPFPKDPHQPPVYGKPVDLDTLICWLAYKEAKALIEGPAAPVPQPSAAK
jgi:tetratricopeptide (TPR) repeat protein